MTAAEKSNENPPSGGTPCVRANAVCFRASGYAAKTVFVDGILNTVIRFHVDHGKVVEIAVSDLMGFGLARELLAEPDLRGPSTMGGAQ